MITYVGIWESDILNPNLEMRMLRQLKGAYNINRIVMIPVMESMKTRSNVDQYETMEEALESCKGTKVFLEPKGTTSLTELPQSEDIVYITGNAYRSNLKYADGEITCKIQSPNDTDMFAVNALAIALAYRNGQE